MFPAASRVSATSSWRPDCSGLGFLVTPTCLQDTLLSAYVRGSWFPIHRGKLRSAASVS